MNQFYNREKFYDGVRSAFGRLNQGQVNGFEVLLGEGEKRNVNTEWMAYILATAWHETGKTMQPVRETFASSDEQAIRNLDKAYAAGKLKWVSKPYWRTGFFGRGYVQLTHEVNYKTMSKWVGSDLVKNPSLAMQPKVAAKITYEGMLRGLFTGKDLSDYLDGVDESDAVDGKEFQNARRIINGTDRASTIKGYALKFEKALRESESAKVGSGDTAAEVVMPDVPGSKKPAAKSKTIWAALSLIPTGTGLGFLGDLHPAVQIGLFALFAGIVIFIIWERFKEGKSIIEGIL